MDNIAVNQNGLVSLTMSQMCRITGGTGGWDYEIAEYLGRGAGYSIKKLWRLFQFLSKNLYEMQANTQVIYK